MICLIFSMDRMGGIGLENDFPWQLTDSYKKWFANHVQDQVIVAGHTTWQLLIKHGMTPWARKTFVVSSKQNNSNVSYVQGDLISEIKRIEQENLKKDIYIVGGKRLLEATRHIADQIHIAHIAGQYRADARIYSGYFLSGYQVYKASPAEDKKCTFMSYHNLFPL